MGARESTSTSGGVAGAPDVAHWTKVPLNLPGVFPSELILHDWKILQQEGTWLPSGNLLELPSYVQSNPQCPGPQL